MILGVYSPDEVEQREEREINPVPAQRMSVQEITSEVSTTTSAQESATNVDAVADDLRERIDTASSVDQAKAIRADIESQKALLGTALFTELKQSSEALLPGRCTEQSRGSDQLNSKPWRTGSRRDVC